ncbi:nucleotide exchange factor GrpE [Halobellus salinus]|uniref:Protein GrpE n=1 Tax=Halobellus salinus TaxID=931585 RepID=A0A830EKB6_9EURY|nr:nucleotide exchange factor GrpE [Halobellus salinus]GGJ13782.1 nucleotide exchange factor GrpE [Halobellus salinus]SMP30807.1 molecular chaperone GrpE [Halobellus salinus]
MSDESSEGRTTAATADDDGTPDGSDSDAEPDGVNGDPTEAGQRDAADLAARVEEYDPDLATAVADLESRHTELESDLAAKTARVDELENALARSKADFKNYKKRAKRREEEIRERATEDFVGRIVSVRDNLVRALDQEAGADIRPGVESTVEEFDRILAEENVTEIAPEPGSDVDPTRHEVLMRVDADHPEGTVAEVYRPGYEMAGSVLREAQVTVSEGGSGDSENGTENGS